MRHSKLVDSDTVHLAGKRALIVDDDDDARQLLRAALESVQMTVCDADSVDRALNEFDQASFDLIVSDIGMPEKDGYTFLREIRARPAGASTPVVALTSFALPADRTRAIRAGFARHIGKPFELTSLISSLSALLKVYLSSP